MNNVFLSLGSNLGNRLEYIETAKKEISVKIGSVIKSSSIYETEPWGYSDSNLYLNQVIQIDTKLEPTAILSQMDKIELSMGRIRGKDQYAARLIDIDILLFGATIFTTHYLIIPHPHIADRRFILTPLNEIAENVIHPVCKKTIKELLAECDDRCEVNIFNA